MRVQSVSDHFDAAAMKKDKNAAAILALFLGFLGIHRFYLRQTGLGVLYLLLAFLFPLTFILGFIDAIVFFSMDEAAFDAKYNRESFGNPRGRDRQRHQRYGQYPPVIDSNPAPFQYRQQNKQKAEAFKQSGVKKFKEYDLQGAIDDFEAALAANPVDIAAHFNAACAYSMIENAQQGFFHLSEAVRLGFKDIEKIKTHDSLAYLRIQPSWDKFVSSGLKYDAIHTDFLPQDEADQSVSGDKTSENSDLLEQLQRLALLKERGILTEGEFEQQKKKLLG